MDDLAPEFIATRELFDRYLWAKEARFDETQRSLAKEVAVILRRLQTLTRRMAGRVDSLLSELATLETIIRQAMRPHPGSRLATRRGKAHDAPEVRTIAVPLEDVPGEGNEGMYDLLEWTASYYYLASRLVSIVRQLPSLRAYDAQAIRSVRNRLLDHCENRDAGELIDILEYAGNVGPMVKAARGADSTEKWQDQGLIPNTRELLRNLNARLDRALR